MYNALTVALIIVSILIILFVIMQPSKSNAASSLTGQADKGAKIRARGFEAFLIRATGVLAALFFILAVALAMLSGQQ